MDHATSAAVSYVRRVGKARDDRRSRTPRPVGRARIGRGVGRAPTPDRAPTEMLRIDADARPPVFVDDSGARRRRLRRIALTVGAVLLLILLVLWASQLGWR
jgi:hypothetical protein